MPYALRAQHDGVNYWLVNRPPTPTSVNLTADAAIGDADGATVPEGAIIIPELADAEREAGILNMGAYVWYPIASHGTSSTDNGPERANAPEVAPEVETRETRGA